MVHSKKYLPVLIGYRDKFDQGRVWCPFCAKWYEFNYVLDMDSGEISQGGPDCDHFPNGYYIKTLNLNELRLILREKDTVPPPSK